MSGRIRGDAEVVSQAAGIRQASERCPAVGKGTRDGCTGQGSAISGVQLCRQTPTADSVIRALVRTRFVMSSRSRDMLWN